MNDDKPIKKKKKKPIKKVPSKRNLSDTSSPEKPKKKKAKKEEIQETPNTKQTKELIKHLKELYAMIGMETIKQNIVNQLLLFLQGLNDSGMFLHTVLTGAPGVGKCHGKDTPIMMYDGTIKMVQDIKVGDKLMGDDSKARNVLSLARGTEQLYKVKQVKGDDYIVNESHILSLRLSCVRSGNTNRYINNKPYKKGDIIDISIKDYLNLSNSLKQKLKGYKVGINYTKQSVPLDPYLIGLWLGDGTSSTSEITNQDSTILYYLINEISKYNCYLTHKDRYTYRIRGCKSKDNFVLKCLQNLNLINNKYIPNIYKFNSKENRIKLLAGIIDTDGSLNNNTFDIIQKNYKLAKDIEFLAKSLGFNCKLKECKKGCVYKDKYKENTYYRLSISGNTHEIPTKIPRKQANIRKQIKNVLNTGIQLEKLEIGEYYGFEIDGNHRYLLEDFTVTHNTTLCHILARIYKSMGFLEKSDVVIADRPALIGQWLGETSIKTKKVLESAKGCVLLIDEAYSLGNEEGRDSFSKECIDTINQYLSEHVDEFVCIIAGYKDDIDKCFFSYNQGLSRRFPWRYHIDNYKYEDMYSIMKIQIEKANWKMGVSEEYILNILKQKKELFKNNGGDTQNLIEKCKVCHAQRIFGTKAEKRLITEEDFKEGIKLFEQSKNQHSKNKDVPMGIYL